jgi:hypothetical protein
VKSNVNNYNYIFNNGEKREGAIEIAPSHIILYSLYETIILNKLSAKKIGAVCSQLLYKYSIKTHMKEQK